ncbi:hypothetical protein W02_33260 [Nitrospira sp. KM1]|uniref:hypothetical protein n=1 Tax=Nitrospira sp. KM1 TaxID=1936990 RepID=UPI0013A75DF7|nr:hypothetical protein [Nitrospira sp. KM1]BCA56186.1 hypothetical protein W02_33260 [Nitrospira sp. KM1]
MKVKGILVEDIEGEEFLVTLRDSTTAGRPAFIVERRERGIWMTAELSPRQTVTITAMALMGLSALLERCGLRLDGTGSDCHGPSANEPPRTSMSYPGLSQ